MRIAIIDDESHWREKIENYVNSYFSDLAKDELEVDIYEDGKNYLESSICYDLSLVDIELPGMDGFQIIQKAKVYNDEGIFIVLTTHTELSRKGYLVNAFRYVDKINMEEELQEALGSAAQLLGRNEKITVNVVGEGNRELVLKNIIYIKSETHCSLIYTKQGVKRCSNPLKEVEKALPEDWFYRCHHSFIINLDEIKKVDNRIIYMSNGDDLDVSIRKISEFKQMYLKRQYEHSNR